MTQPRRFAFPDDHAAHEDYRIEWWYYTGNVQTAAGRRFGFQLTFFRTGVDYQPENPSRWAIRDLYMAHFAISDIQTAAFHFFERLNRRGLGAAGAATDRYHVWNGNWEVQLEGETHRLKAEQNGCRIDLRLVSCKPPVVHGAQGVSKKGPTPGNASYYYSLTRMKTSGLICLDGRVFEVSGLSWMDHEFSTSFLEKGQQGWDWFALQMDDGRELMIYQIRRDDGTADPFSSGTLVDRHGHSQHIARGQFSLVPGSLWRSPSKTSGAKYPTRWTIDIPDHQLELDVRAAFPNQELDTSGSTGLHYWEGAIVFHGQAAGQPARGRGYLEMTGYAGRSLGQILD